MLQHSPNQHNVDIVVELQTGAFSPEGSGNSVHPLVQSLEWYFNAFHISSRGELDNAGRGWFKPDPAGGENKVNLVLSWVDQVIYVDTNLILSYIDEADPYHEKAVELIKTLGDRRVVSNSINTDHD